MNVAGVSASCRIVRPDDSKPVQNQRLGATSKTVFVGEENLVWEV